MKKILAMFAGILTCCLTGAETAQDAMFFPRKAPTAAQRVALEAGGGGMRYVRGELDGKPCLMLFDTGATHTTFDLAFVKREFPGAQLQQVVDTGDTNVNQIPSLFHVDTLKIGEAEFSDFTGIAIGLPGLVGPSGERIAGVVGMNIIDSSRTLVSFGRSEVVFGLGVEARDGFEKPVRRINAQLDYSILVGADCGKGAFKLIVDSASSWTFLPRDCGWPATTNQVAFTARDINGAEGLNPVIGEKGALMLAPDAKIEIAPLLVPQPLNRIGADTLSKYDMLIEPRAVAFRKDKTKDETKAE